MAADIELFDDGEKTALPSSGARSHEYHEAFLSFKTNTDPQEKSSEGRRPVFVAIRNKIDDSVPIAIIENRADIQCSYGKKHGPPLIEVIITCMKTSLVFPRPRGADPNTKALFHEVVSNALHATIYSRTLLLLTKLSLSKVL